MTYADTSFIGSLSVPDVNTDAALNYMEQEHLRPEMSRACREGLMHVISRHERYG